MFKAFKIGPMSIYRGGLSNQFVKSFWNGAYPYWKDVFVKKVRKIYEAIDEATMESNYEFLTDADMEELGWSETPGSIHVSVIFPSK